MLFATRQAELQQRRRVLLAHSRALRIHIALDAQPLKRPLALADQVHAGARWLAAHPQWPAAGVVLLAALRPRKAIGWALRAWGGWRLWRQVRGAVQIALSEAQRWQR